MSTTFHATRVRPNRAHLALVAPQDTPPDPPEHEDSDPPSDTARRLVMTSSPTVRALIAIGALAAVMGVTDALQAAAIVLGPTGQGTSAPDAASDPTIPTPDFPSPSSDDPAMNTHTPHPTTHAANAPTTATPDTRSPSSSAPSTNTHTSGTIAASNPTTAVSSAPSVNTHAANTSPPPSPRPSVWAPPTDALTVDYTLRPATGQHRKPCREDYHADWQRMTGHGRHRRDDTPIESPNAGAQFAKLGALPLPDSAALFGHAVSR